MLRNIKMAWKYEGELIVSTSAFLPSKTTLGNYVYVFSTSPEEYIKEAPQ